MAPPQIAYQVTDKNGNVIRTHYTDGRVYHHHPVVQVPVFVAQPAPPPPPPAPVVNYRWSDGSVRPFPPPVKAKPAPQHIAFPDGSRRPVNTNRDVVVPKAKPAKKDETKREGL